MIESHINHFSGYGHTRIDNVDKMQMIWSNMLVELSKLNAKWMIYLSHALTDLIHSNIINEY